MESSGTTASLGVFGYALIALLMSFLRSDPSRFWFGLRLDTWGSIVPNQLIRIGISSRFTKKKTKSSD